MASYLSQQLAHLPFYTGVRNTCTPHFFPSIQTTVESALQRGGKEKLQAREEKKKEAITNRKRIKLKTNNNIIMMEISGYDC